MGELNAVPMRINRVEGAAGQVKVSGGPGVLETWATPAAVPSGIIDMWHGTIANIPAGYLICDGNNSTPNLLARFVQGVATAATDPGATGGASNKTTTGHVHGSAAHQHDAPIAFDSGNSQFEFNENSQFGTGGNISPTHLIAYSTGSSGTIASAKVKSTTPGNTDSETDSITDIRPLFYDIAFLMKS